MQHLQLEQALELEGPLTMAAAVSVPMGLIQMWWMLVPPAFVAGLAVPGQAPSPVDPTEIAVEEGVGHTLAVVRIVAAAVVVAEALSTLEFLYPGTPPFRKSAVMEASPEHP